MVPLNPKPRLPPFPNAPPTAVPRCSIFSLCLSKMLEMSSVFGILGICLTTLTSFALSVFSKEISILATALELVEEDVDPTLGMLVELLLSSFFFKRDEEDPDCC